MVKLRDKLDVLQEMAQEHRDAPGKTYLIALLAEHAQDEEMTESFLRWIAEIIR